MFHPTTRFAVPDATPATQQWSCCAVAVMASMNANPWAWQANLYQVAYAKAVETVQAAEFRQHIADWN